MTQSAIQIEHLSKRYRLGTSTGIGRLLRRGSILDALHNVSFDVAPGEAIGIIGRNGAGKSTLLKILSRITPPTSGKVTLRGRVASLLEVGTGFHPELSGSENIYLNGSLLGMKRREIKAKFNQIAEFSGVEGFLDTPVKRYSSGMRVRLAFAVAAHLEPEILIVDEVLAVGDAAFQQRCLGKMKDVAGSGRTVLFVSHQMSAITKLCRRVVWLEGGQVRADGPAQQLVGMYLNQDLPETGQALRERMPTQHGGAFYQAMRILDEHNHPITAATCGKPITVEAHICAQRSIGPVQCGLDISTLSGTRVLNVNSRLLGHEPLVLGRHRVLRWTIDELRLTPGRYLLGLRMKDAAERDFIDHEPNAAVLEVLPARVYDGDTMIGTEQGLTYMPIRLEAA